MKEENTRQNRKTRRCFLADCTKLSLGATLIGLSVKSFGNTQDSWEDYSYCIFKCPQPCSYNQSCIGCRDDETMTCPVKECAIENEMPSCAHCENLEDCDKDLWINYPGQREFALNKQKAWGLLSNLDDSSAKQVGFRLFPSVTSDKVTIINMRQMRVNYRLFDLTGQIVKESSFTGNKYHLDLSNLHSGNYILNIYKNNKSLHVCKIIKK